LPAKNWRVQMMFKSAQDKLIGVGIASRNLCLFIILIEKSNHSII